VQFKPLNNILFIYLLSFSTEFMYIFSNHIIMFAFNVVMIVRRCGVKSHLLMAVVIIVAVSEKLKLIQEQGKMHMKASELLARIM